DAPHRGLATGAHPDRGVRTLGGRRLDHDIVERPVFAPMRERLVRGPRFDKYVEAFVKPRAGLIHVDAKAAELVVAIAAADAEIEPAAGEQVKRRGLLGEQYRVVPGQHDDRGAEAKGRGAGAKPGQQVERRGDLAVAREVMLDNESAAKAERLGF